jgi:branched-chain amino acid transport system substrate-binding protein
MYPKLKTGAGRSSARLSVVAAGVTVAALAAACGGSSSGTGAKNGGSKTYTVAFQGPLTGDNAQLGINGLDGAQLAVDEANASHALPYTLKLEQDDDQGDPSQAPSVAQKIVGNPNVIALVGPMFSGATKASESYFSAAHLLSISPSATNTTLTHSGFTTFFRVIAPDSAQGSEAAKYITQALHAKKVYAVSDKSDYGQGVTDDTVKGLKAAGVGVTEDGVAEGTKDYNAEATKIKQSGADVVYYGGYYADGGLFSKALRAAGFTGPLVSDDGLNDDKYIQLAGPQAAANTYMTCGCTDARVDPTSKDFFTQYKQKFNADPGTYSPEAYDATNALISVLKTVGSSPSRQAVADAFKSVNFKGITKQVQFDLNGDILTPTIYLYAAKDGKRVLLGTVDSLAH